MKRLRLWLRELNLTQQLLSIVFFVVSSMTIFLFTILSPQVNEFTSAQMYRSLHVAHVSASYYLNATGEGVEMLKDAPQTGIIQSVYDPTDQSFQVFGTAVFSQDELQDIQSHVEEVTEEAADFSFSGSGKDKDRVFYTMSRLDNGEYLISLMPSAYGGQFRQTLINNIVNLNMLIALVLFVILTIWIATLIYPLNQIKSYVTKIKNDEPAVLAIDRRDEIGEVADALREMQTELQKQKREKEEMIQNISHDLKTPIATIKSYGESIKDGIYPYGTLEQSVDVIIEHADRLEKKVRSMIALNKMGYLLDDCPAGDALDMNQVVDKVLLSLKVIRPEISFETELDKGVFFHGDEDPWRIVIENLVDNALRYARSTVRLELHPGELKVINDGSHLSEDRLSKLFKPYEKGTDGQFGLGLSIVYKVVTTYGYHVSAENLTDGVVFRIWKDLGKKELQAIEKTRKQDARIQKKNKDEKTRKNRNRPAKQA